MQGLLNLAGMTFNKTEIPVRAQRCSNRRIKLLIRQLNFFLVVIDIKIPDYSYLRSLSGLTGTQDNPYKRVIQIITNALYHLEPGILLLHDYIQQKNRSIRIVPASDQEFRVRYKH